MNSYESLLEKARVAALATIGEPDAYDTFPEDQLMEDAWPAIDAILPDPEALDPEWVAALVKDCPDLLHREAGHKKTLAETIIWALSNKLSDDLDELIFEAAREKGIEMPKPRTP